MIHASKRNIGVKAIKECRDVNELDFLRKVGHKLVLLSYYNTIHLLNSFARFRGFVY
jgi:hypothetical protein